MSAPISIPVVSRDEMVDHPISPNGKPPMAPNRERLSSQHSPSQSAGVGKDRRKSLEERRTEAEETFETWRVDLINTLGSITMLQKDLTKLDIKTTTMEEMSVYMEEALVSFNNVHIIVHNVMNGLLPIMPEPKLHEMGSPNEFSTLLSSIQQMGESTDKIMAHIYSDYGSKCGDAADTKDPNARTLNIRSAVTTGHFNLLRTLRATACQLLFAMSLLERKKLAIIELFSGVKGMPKHEGIFL